MEHYTSIGDIIQPFKNPGEYIIEAELKKKAIFQSTTESVVNLPSLPHLWYSLIWIQSNVKCRIGH